MNDCRRRAIAKWRFFGVKRSLLAAARERDKENQRRATEFCELRHIN
jgi:hypothetical protein